MYEGRELINLLIQRSFLKMLKEICFKRSISWTMSVALTIGSQNANSNNKEVSKLL